MRQTRDVAEFANLLALPDEFVLLVHRPNGTCDTAAGPVLGTVAAEVAELALQRRVEVRDGVVRLVDGSSTGQPWMDRMLAEFRDRAGEGGELDLRVWLQSRTGAFRTHRHVLVERGLLRRERRRFLGVFPDDRYHPDRPNRDALVAELREAARGDRPLDDRLALLCALVYRTGLVHVLGFAHAEVTRMRAIAAARDLGDGVDPRIADMLVAVTTIPAAVATG